MASLPVKPIREDIGVESPHAAPYLRKPVVFGVGLFLLLAYCTSVAFVPQAWATQSFQIGIFALVAICLLLDIRRKRMRLLGGPIPWLIYAIPFWGIFQIVAHTTASTVETREETLRWGALAGVFFLMQIVARSNLARRNFLTAFLVFATAMAVLCLTQLFTSEGRVLWIFPSGFPDVYATFPSYNHYAQLIEIALPIALWRAVREGSRAWWCILAGGVMYGSVVGSASRAGAVLCTLEVLAILVLGLVSLRKNPSSAPPGFALAILLVVPAIAGAFTVVVGWERVWQRFQTNDLYGARSEFIMAAIDMARHRPIAGYGLGTFHEVYQRYALHDMPYYANHAHNDWAEFAADGGVPFLLLVLIPFAAAIPAAMRNPWAIGLIAVMLHACLDFPFPRAAVSCWMFAMLGLVYMAEWSNRNSRPLIMPPIGAKTGAYRSS
jgi:O-antigen ligase